MVKEQLQFILMHLLYIFQKCFGSLANLMMIKMENIYQ